MKIFVLACFIGMSIPIPAETLLEKATERLDTDSQTRAWVVVREVRCMNYLTQTLTTCLLVQGPNGHVIVPLRRHYI